MLQGCALGECVGPDGRNGAGNYYLHQIGAAVERLFADCRDAVGQQDRCDGAVARGMVADGFQFRVERVTGYSLRNAVQFGAGLVAQRPVVTREVTVAACHIYCGEVGAVVHKAVIVEVAYRSRNGEAGNRDVAFKCLAGNGLYGITLTLVLNTGRNHCLGNSLVAEAQHGGRGTAYIAIVGRQGELITELIDGNRLCRCLGKSRERRHNK